MVCGMRRSFRESIKSLEADIHYANTLASRYRREPDGAYFQMRLSFSPAAHLFLFLVQWSDFYLAGALGLLRVLIFMTYADGKTTISVYEKKASIKQFYAVIFPSLLQLQSGITEVEDRKQREVCSLQYRKTDVATRDEYTEFDRELEDECGICMEMNSKVVLPDCSHSLCLKCYQDCTCFVSSKPERDVVSTIMGVVLLQSDCSSDEVLSVSASGLLELIHALSVETVSLESKLVTFGFTSMTVTLLSCRLQ